MKDSHKEKLLMAGKHRYMKNPYLRTHADGGFSMLSKGLLDLAQALESLLLASY